MIRQLLIEIDCGDTHCEGCDRLNQNLILEELRETGRTEGAICMQFHRMVEAASLPSGPFRRCPECKAAEVTGGSIGLAPMEGGGFAIVPCDPQEVPPNAEYIDIGTGKGIDGLPIKWLKITFERDS